MDLAQKFRQLYARPPEVETRAPGRVNLLGEHVDYNQGVVLPAAINYHVSILAAPLQSDMSTLYALDLGQEISFKLSGIDQRSDAQGNPLPGWALYPAGVAWALQHAGFKLSGMQALFSGDIPIGAGLSSSAAVEVAFAITWQALSGFNLDKLALAKLCQKAENEYVGVSSGLMDQFTSLFGVERHVLCFDTRSLEWEALELPANCSVVIADTGIRRSLADSAYNDRRAACEQAVEYLKKYLPEIQSLRDVSTVELAAYSPYLPPEVARRAEHVVKEIHRVEQAIIALKRNDAQRFGGFMFASHKTLRDLYQVSIPELDCLVEIARGLPGIYGARLTGAGFGGCTVNLVEEPHVASFIHGLQAGYQARTGRETVIYPCKASSGAITRQIDS